VPKIFHLCKLTSERLVDLAEVNEGDLANIRDEEIQLQDDDVFNITDNIENMDDILSDGDTDADD